MPLLIAAATFALFFVWLGVPILWSAAAGLASLVCAELAFPTRRGAGPRTAAPTLRDAYVRSDAIVARLSQLAAQVSAPEKRDVQRQLQEIRDAASAVLSALREDNEKRDQVFPFLEYLEFSLGVVERYAKLGRRRVSTAETELTATEEEWLPRIERQLRSFHEQLHRVDVAELAVDGEMLDLMRPLVDSVQTSRLLSGRR